MLIRLGEGDFWVETDNVCMMRDPDDQGGPYTQTKIVMQDNSAFYVEDAWYVGSRAGLVFVGDLWWVNPRKVCAIQKTGEDRTTIHMLGVTQALVIQRGAVGVARILRWR